MDEYNVSMLSSSKDEWISRIISILTPLLIEGIKSIFVEAFEVCKKTNEDEKYLMTFQNFISRIPKWNNTIIENERKRIIEKSGCNYLEDLVTCVHIIQLKLLSAVRVGQKQKKIDINIIKLDDFLHKVYINIARKVYKNVYLFELNIQPLQIQKNNRELEIIVQECILFTIRDSIPIENILKVYLDEIVEEDVTEEVNERIVNEKINYSVLEKEMNETNALKEKKENIQPPPELSVSKQTTQLKEINNETKLVNDNNIKITFDEISPIKERGYDDTSHNGQDYDEDSEEHKLKILDEDINLTNFDIHELGEPSYDNIKINNDLLLTDIEILT